MSPEQTEGDRRVDARADQYSLACVLYELLAGQPPFTGPTLMACCRGSCSIPFRRSPRCVPACRGRYERRSSNMARLILATPCLPPGREAE